MQFRSRRCSRAPNAGAFYLIDNPVKVIAQVRVNYVALSVNSDFYNRQRNQPTGPWCGKPQVVPFVPVVEQHEGLNFEPNSHTGLYRATLNTQSGPAMEPLVAMSFDLLQDGATAALQPIRTAALLNSDRADSQFAPVYCAFRYF